MLFTTQLKTANYFFESHKCKLKKKLMDSVLVFDEIVTIFHQHNILILCSSEQNINTHIVYLKILSTKGIKKSIVILFWFSMRNWHCWR